MQNANLADKSDSQIKLCFILGILQRSGTNYLFRLLREHPGCIGPGPIWEDFLVHHSELLKKYANIVYKSWNPKWEVEKKIGPQEILLRFFGDSLKRYLMLQQSRHQVDQPDSNQRNYKENGPKILLTKSPSVVGLEYFFDLFPDDYLIIIIRDGRAVVESGVRSFDWNYENTMRRWTAGAQAIHNLKKKYQNSNKKLLIVKYEDLFMDEKGELLKISAFLGLDPGLFDFERVKSLGVTGSSEIKKYKDTINWQVTEKSKEFNPIQRFSNWDRKKHDRFNWISGQLMTMLGYDIEANSFVGHTYAMRNKLLDLKWRFKTIILKVAALIKKNVKK